MRHATRAMKLGLTFLLVLTAGTASAQADKPIRIGISTAVALQVGRDTQDCVKMAIDDINAKGGVLGRKLEMVVADETENPETGISAIKKLTGDEKVDVLMGGYTSGVTLAQLPHISAAKTIYMGVGAASPAITAKVKQDYENYKYVFRVSPHQLGRTRRERGRVRDGVRQGRARASTRWRSSARAPSGCRTCCPVLKKGVKDGGVEGEACRSSSTPRPPTSRRSSPR